MMRVRPVLVACAALAFVTGPAAAPPPGDVIRVKGVSGDTVLSLVPSVGGGLVHAGIMARLLGGSLDSVDAGRWTLTLYGARLELREGAPFAGYNGFTLPLLESTRRIDGAPHVALQLFSEILPRFGIGILWDRTRWEVRLFQGIARRSVPTGPGDAQVAATPVAAAPVTTESAGEAPPRAPASGTAARTPPRSTPREVPLVTPTRNAAPVRDGLSRRYTIVVDAGHGGRDPGMQGAMVNGRRLSEARITLQVAKRLQRMLEAEGFSVVMTRTTDTLIALHDRGPIANRAKGDIFLSIHVNSANPRWKNAAGARGFETFFLSTARTEDEQHVAAMENEVVRFETEAPAPRGDDALAFILNDLARNEHLRESSELASVVQQRLGVTHPSTNRGVKQAGLAVLATAYMPAVLVELGFGSNAADARWMASEEGQQHAARAIADAAFEYLQHYERRTHGGQR